MKETKQLSIEGMTCQNCVRHVRQALAGVKGLSVLDVSVGSAVVNFDPAEVSEDEVLQAVSEAGYQATARAA